MPLDTLGFDPGDLAKPGVVWQIGLPPKRIDILTAIAGVVFDDAYATRCVHEVDGLPVPFLGLEAVRANKAATGRTKDRADLELLDERASSRADGSARDDSELDAAGDAMREDRDVLEKLAE